jgi:hypothetical protein
MAGNVAKTICGNFPVAAPTVRSDFFENDEWPSPSHAILRWIAVEVWLRCQALIAVCQNQKLSGSSAFRRSDKDCQY